MKSFGVVTGHPRIILVAAAATAALVYGILSAVEGGSAAPGAQAPSPTAAASATQAASPTATPTSTPAPATPEPAVQPKPVAPGEKVTADVARVHTGDGDCLNVRPSPGTTFAIEPYSCVPEGTLLWLSGPAVDVDGETWRFALGQGWVAVRYTVAEQAPSVRLPAGKLVTWERGQYREPKPGDATGGSSDVVVAITDLQDPTRPVRFVFPGFVDMMGASNPAISPDGRRISFGTGNGDWTTASTIVGNLSDGSTKRIEGWSGVGWSSTGRLMLAKTTSCETVCLTLYGTYDAGTGALVPLTGEPAQLQFLAWTADGETAYFRRTDGGAVVRYDLAGAARQVGTLADEDAIWSGVPSPDGTRLLGMGGLNALNLFDVGSGRASKFTRAGQRELPGKCGGGWSQVFGWLDGSRIFYHERSSSGRQDGVTIGDLATGKRVVYPFYNVQDLTSPAPGLLSFSTWVSDAERSYTVTFVLDTATGQAMPLVTGTGATWVR
ncbi:MAG: hypothetical protein ACKVT1_14620 [Dehalococcoidia bacterium]